MPTIGSAVDQLLEPLVYGSSAVGVHASHSGARIAPVI
jgi:hypothetical protein